MPLLPLLLELAQRLADHDRGVDVQRLADRVEQLQARPETGGELRRLLHGRLLARGGILDGNEDAADRGHDDSR